MAISRVASGNGAAGSAAFSGTYSVGNLIILVLQNTSGASTPAIPSGYTNIASAADSANTHAMRAVYKYAVSSSETMPTLTNATAVSWAIYAGTAAATPAVQIAGQSGVGTSMSVSGIVSYQNPANDWVVICATGKGITGNIGSHPPNSMTLVQEYKTGSNDNALFDSNTALSSYGFNSKTLDASVSWLTKTFELVYLSAPATSGTGTLSASTILTSSATKATSGTAAASGTTALTSPGIKTARRSAALTGTTGLSSSASKAGTGAGTQSASTALSGLGLKVASGTATAPVGTALASGGTHAGAANPTLTASPGLTGAGGGAASAILGAAGGLAAAGTHQSQAAATLSVLADLTAISGHSYAGNADVSAVSSVEATGTKSAQGHAVTSAVATPAITGAPARQANTQVPAITGLTALAGKTAFNAESLTASVTLTSTSLARLRLVTTHTLSVDARIAAREVIGAVVLSDVAATSATGLRLRLAATTLTLLSAMRAAGRTNPVHRPYTGTVVRPYTGTVVRPYTGVVHRP